MFVVVVVVVRSVGAVRKITHSDEFGFLTAQRADRFFRRKERKKDGIANNKETLLYCTVLSYRNNIILLSINVLNDDVLLYSTVEFRFPMQRVKIDFNPKLSFQDLRGKWNVFHRLQRAV